MLQYSTFDVVPCEFTHYSFSRCASRANICNIQVTIYKWFVNILPFKTHRFCWQSSLALPIYIYIYKINGEMQTKIPTQGYATLNGSQNSTANEYHKTQGWEQNPNCSPRATLRQRNSGKRGNWILNYFTQQQFLLWYDYIKTAKGRKIEVLVHGAGLGQSGCFTQIITWPF